MLLIADQNIYTKYFTACFERVRSKDINNLKACFENPNNIILLSLSMLERIENELISKPALLNEFQSFIKEITDNNRLKTLESNNISEENDILEIYSSARLYNDVFGIVDIYKSGYSSVSKNFCFWEQYKLPNKNWIILSLLANENLTVRYSDFKSDAEIKVFFEDYFNLDSRTTDVKIIDSYCHLHKHTNFELLKNRYIVRIYTSSYKKNQFQLNTLRSDIKSYFGSSSIIKFSSNNSITHERTIAKSNFILECNHDFGEIKRRNRNWKIDITYSLQLKNDIDSKVLGYN